MSQIVPQGELVRRAAAYIAEKRCTHPQLPVPQLIDEAGMRFNLSPLESEALLALFSHTSADATAIKHGSENT